MAAFALLASSAARADSILGENGLSDAANYAVLFTGGGTNNQLQINNGPGPGGLAVTGNIGIAGTGALGASGPLVINGNIDFASTLPNPVTNPAGGNIVINGTYTGGHTNVQTDINGLSTLSGTYGGLSGTGLSVNLNNNQSQTIMASLGTVHGSDSVFNVSSFNFGNGATLTIQGDGTHNVVLNFASSASFGGTILLTGGLTADDVLFNITGSNNTLQISTNGATETGMFLDPNGTVSINHSVLDGRLFGGDSQNMSIVSGGEVNAPPVPAATPLPSTAWGCVVLLGGLGLAKVHRRFAAA